MSIDSFVSRTLIRSSAVSIPYHFDSIATYTFLHFLRLRTIKFELTSSLSRGELTSNEPSAVDNRVSRKLVLFRLTNIRDPDCLH